MMTRLLVRTCGFCLLVWGLGPLAFAADVGEAIRTIRQVAPEARGNAAARAAMKELSAAGPEELPRLFESLDGANPLASNYLRSAIESIAQKALASEKKLPVDELGKFLAETSHEPRARRLAFELIARVDPTARERLIPTMLNDPSVELRRDAVAQKLKEADALFEKGEKDQSKAPYSLALAAARDDDQVKAAKKRLEELGEKVDLSRHFGFLQSWKLIAPFDNTAGKGLKSPYPPETELNFDAEYEGKEGQKVRWVPYSTQDEYGVVDLAKALSPFKGAVSYATTEFVSDKAQTVDFRLGTPNSWKVWLNGKLLFSREEYHRGMSLDQYKVRGTLQPGKNVILIKVCQNEQTEEWAQRWQFQFRVCDATGTAILSADRGSAARDTSAGSSD